MCSIAFQEQYKGGREATLEHPWLSRAWNTRAFACLEETVMTPTLISARMVSQSRATQEHQGLQRSLHAAGRRS